MSPLLAAIYEPLQHRKEMRRFAAQAALASAAFKTWDDDRSGVVTYEELTNVILHEASKIDEATARGISAVLCGGRGANDGITLKVHIHPSPLHKHVV